MLFALGFIALFIIGGLSGITHAAPPADRQQQDTYYIVAHLHYVLFGGSIFGLFAGLYYWFPKMTGRLLGERLGKIHFWLMFVGMNVTFGPMHLLGLDGMPRRIYTYPSDMGWDLWNLVSSIGAYAIGVSMVVFIYNVFISLRQGEVAGSDPWDGRTLEWSIPSPPPIYNFATIPTVHGRDAFWHQKYVESEEGRPLRVPAGAAEAHATSSNTEAGPPSGIHMPQPSYFPVIVALGLLLFGAGFVLSFPISALGVLVALVGIYGWAFEPVVG